MPPEPIHQEQDLSLYRTEVVRERAGEARRLEKLLEDAGIELSSMVSNILGSRAGACWKSLIAGKRAPACRPGRPEASCAADRRPHRGPDQEPRRSPCVLGRTMPDQIVARRATDSRLSEPIGLQITPFRRQIEPLMAVPGVNTRTPM